MPLLSAAPYVRVLSAAVRGQRLEVLHDADALAALPGLLRPGDVFIDVGAGNGRLSALASRLVGPTGTVVAFEPDADARKRMPSRERFANAVVEPLALGEVELPGVAQTLDAYVALHRLVPTWIRVDAAGREPAVLAGAKQTLETYRPGLIVDFDPRSAAATGTRPAALAAWLRSLGYDLSVLENDAWGRFDVRRKSPFDAALHCRAGASANVVCLAPPRAASTSRVA